MGAAGDSAQAQLQAKIDAKQHELEVAVSAKTVALRRLKELEYMKESVVAECNTIVESVKAENTQLLEAVKRYQRRNEVKQSESFITCQRGTHRLRNGLVPPPPHTGAQGGAAVTAHRVAC